MANTKAFDASDGSSAKVFLGSSPEGLYFHGKNYDDHGSSPEGIYSTGSDCITKAFEKWWSVPLPVRPCGLSGWRYLQAALV